MEKTIIKITTKFLIDTQDINADDLVTAQLTEGLSFGAYEIMSSQKVGPTIADDIKDAAVWSVFFSLLVIFSHFIAFP